MAASGDICGCHNWGVGTAARPVGVGRGCRPTPRSVRVTSGRRPPEHQSSPDVHDAEEREWKSLRHVENTRLCRLPSPSVLTVQQNHMFPGAKNRHCCCMAFATVMSPLGAARFREEDTGEGRALRSTRFGEQGPGLHCQVDSVPRG